MSDARGGSLVLRAIGWDVEVAQRAASMIGVARPGGDAREVVVATAPALARLGELETAALRALVRRGVPVVAEGGEAALASALGIAAVNPTPAIGPELVAVREANGRLLRARFISVAPEARTSVPEDAFGPEAREALLARALAWSLREVEPAVPSAAVAAARPDGPGAWNAIGSQEWEYYGWSLDWATIANVFTVTANGFKIQDLRSDRDWYLVDVRVAHQANADGRGQVSHPYCSHGEIGWYVRIHPEGDDRFFSLSRDLELRFARDGSGRVSGVVTRTSADPAFPD